MDPMMLVYIVVAVVAVYLGWKYFADK